MERLKKYMGFVWMLLAPLLIGLLGWQAWEKIAHAPAAARSNTALQWVIILCVFVPICIGFFIFGYYAQKGYYHPLPQSSGDWQDNENG
jgi:ABC-type polysaccharide/polyol phosphate export permease